MTSFHSAILLHLLCGRSSAVSALMKLIVSEVILVCRHISWQRWWVPWWEYMGLKSDQTEGWKLGESSGRLQEEIATEAASWTTDKSLSIIQMETQKNRFSGKDNESSLGCEALSCLWDIQKAMGYWVLERSKPEMPLWIPQAVGTHGDQGGWGGTMRGDS